MTRRLISTGSPFERDFAYARAVVDGDWCFVAGTTGYDYARMAMPEDPGQQAENALSTIRATLAEAGFAMEDVVKVTYIVTEADLRHAIAPAIRAAFAEIRPASTMVIAGLVEPEMKVEIEVVAKRRAADGA
ncbi:MAG: RidA family protein [Pseudomonadota bacterium]